MLFTVLNRLFKSSILVEFIIKLGSFLSSLNFFLIQVLPGMVERGKGTILFSGCSASLRGLAGLPDLCNIYI